jgi:hypothetical protein
MNRLEDRLRDAFKADADTVRPETIPSVPARPHRPARSRRARILIPLAAATAVIAVVVGVSLAVPLVGAPGQRTGTESPSPSRFPFPTVEPPVSHAPLPQPVFGHDGQPASTGVPASASLPGVPKYYVTATIGQPAADGVPPQSLVVRVTATGTVVGTVEAPPGTSFISEPVVAATAGDRTFITAISPNSSECSSQLYQFQLNGQGVPGPLTPLNITIPGTYVETGTLVITPDGSTIAYDTDLCSQNRAEIGIIDLATRHVGTWEIPGTAPSSSTSDLSLSPDGTRLVYETWDAGAAILSTSAPNGLLAGYSHVVSRTAAWAAFGTDSATLFTCSIPGNPLATVGSETYGSQPVAGGSQRTIASWHNVQSPTCWASPDPSGSGYLLIEYPASVGTESGWVKPAVLNISTGQLSPIAAAPSFFSPMDLAW